MTLRLLTAVSVGLWLPAFLGQACAVELELVSEESSIEFVGSKPDGEKHKGGFKQFTVATLADFEEPSRSSLNIQIDSTSLWSDNEKLTEHLKGPDFFDVETYPVITFESTEIEPVPGDTPAALIKGDMHMLGVAVAVDVPIKATLTEEAVVVSAEFTIDRSKWGMTYGQGKIDNEVKIKAKLSLRR